MRTTSRLLSTALGWALASSLLLCPTARAAEIHLGVGLSPSQAFLAAGPGAGSPEAHTLRWRRVLPWVSDLGGGSLYQRRVGFDTEVFLHQLFAFSLKEAFPDAVDEYAWSSNIPTRLSDEGVERRNDFGRNCLLVVAAIRAMIFDEASGASSANMATPAIQSVGATLQLAPVWSALRREIRQDRSGVSLKPKVGSRKLLLSLTYRW